MKTRFVITAVLAMLLFAVAGFAQDQGGPDDYGYTWKTSNATDGPVYSWVEPDTTNDAVALYTEFDDDGNTPMLPLNFDFPYYGNLYSEICIGTNGIIGFSTETMTHRFSQDFPDVTLPDNIFAWMYTDLNPLYTWTDSHCYYENITYNDSDAFMITFVDYAEFGSSGTYPASCISAQILLVENGDIIFNYDYVGSAVDLSDVSIGMENDDATDGLCYVCDDVNFSIPEEFAIQFYRPIPLDDDLAALNISGNRTPTVGIPAEYSVTISNPGINTQDTYTVVLKDADGNELASASGTEVAQYETVQVAVTWTPNTEGDFAIHGEVVLDGDENDVNNTSDSMTLEVQPEGILVVTLGNDTTTSNYMPFNYYYRNSLSESIFFPDELGLDEGGLLTGVRFFNHFPEELDCEAVIDTTVNVWVGETDLDSLSAGYIPSTDLTQVFTGLVEFPLEDNDIMITFDEPFQYNGGNLVILTHRPWDVNWYDSDSHFYYSTTPDRPGRTISSCDDTTEFDPANPPTDDATVYDRHPNISLYFDNTSSTGIAGYVYDDQTSPIANATVTLTPGDVQLVTDASGAYSFMGIDPGTYSVTAVAAGYVSHTEDGLVVVDGETNNYNFNLEAVMTVTITVTTNAGSAEGAALTFSNGTETYEEIVPESGLVYFYEIDNGTYTLDITLDDFEDYSDNNVVVDGSTEVEAQLVELIIPASNPECTIDGYFTWDAPEMPANIMRSSNARKQTVANTTRNNKSRRQETMDRSFQHYNIYLDGSSVTTTTSTNYQYDTTGMTVGQTYTAGVGAQYESGESEVVTVDFIYGQEELYAPINVACDSTGYLTWESGQPAALLRNSKASKNSETMDRDFIQYRVYLDDEYVDWTLNTHFEFDGLEVNTTYTAGVSAFYTSGNSTITEVEFVYMPQSSNPDEVVPAITGIIGNYPNPFNPETNIQFSLSKAGQTTLTIYNVKGQKVKTLFSGHMEAKVHTLSWNGKDDGGKNVTSGVYYAVLKSVDSTPGVKKMLLLK